jgi:integrase
VIRKHRGGLKIEQRLDGEVWILRFKATREFDNKRVERTRVVGRVQDFQREEQAFAEAERLRLYTIDPGSKRGTLTFAFLADFYLQQLKKAPASKKRKRKAASTIEDRERIIRERLLPRFGKSEALRIKPFEIKAWLESVQDKEDLENSTVDKYRRVMHLVYSTAQANDLIPRTLEANPLNHVHIATTTEYEAILVTPQEAWEIISRMKPFERLLTLIVAVTGLRIGEVLALRWKHIDWVRLRIQVVSNFVRGEFGEPKSAASKKPVVLHPLVMGLLKNWRETTAYAGDEDFIFASDRLKGKQPRVPNMLVEDHLRPAAKQVIEIPDGHRFGFHNLRHALTSFLVEIGTDPKTIQDMLRWADPSILLKVYAHSRMDKRMEAQAKMIAAMGLNEKTAQQLIQ